ncbi:MAG: septum formation initiator family protein [Eubacteriales bacterium]|nr:septum formation initiator family protein [Eubacteriales bacterium]
MSSKKRYQKNNRKGMIGISAVVLILLGVMLLQSGQLRRRNEAYAIEVASLENQIEEEKARTTQIAEFKEYINTPEYAGERARENLGLCAEDEILFRSEN